MRYQRPHEKTLRDRLNEPVSKMIIVAGPRQVGKTTLVRSALQTRAPYSYRYLPVGEPRSSFSEAPSDPDGRTLDGDIVDTGIEKPDVAWLTKQWEKARIAADRLADFSGAVDKPNFVLALDEVQKIPNWSEAVKGLWDADRRADWPMHVILLGSAPLLMQKGLSESLAGRFELIRMTHWSFTEMNEAFGIDLPQYIYFGGYPGSADYISDQKRWVSYVRDSLLEPNIRKDILMMTKVDKPVLLKNLFELGCQYSGQELSYNKMKGQLEEAGNTTTLAKYLNLLTVAGLLTGLEKHTGGIPGRRASSPKLNVLNTALMTAPSGYSFEEARSDRSYWGRLVKSAVGAHLYNLGFPDYQLYYWREGSNEVDFVLKKGSRLLAVEVEPGDRGGGQRGLDAFSKEFNPHREILVGDKDMPLVDFLGTTHLEGLFD